MSNDQQDDRSSQPGYPNFDDVRTIHMVPVQLLDDDPFQVRDEVNRETVAQIAESLKLPPDTEPGEVPDDVLISLLKNPLRIRRGQNGEVYVLGGSQRKAALLQAGWDRAPCRVTKGVDSEVEVIDDQIIDNELRRGLPPANLGDRYLRAMELHGFKTQQELATHFGLELSHVNQRLSLVPLPEVVKAQINLGRIRLGPALLLGRLFKATEDEDLVTQAGLQVSRLELSHRQLRALVAKYEPKRKPRSRPEPPEEPAVETDESHALSNGKAHAKKKAASRFSRIQEQAGARAPAMDDMGSSEDTIFDGTGDGDDLGPGTQAPEVVFEVSVDEVPYVVVVEGDNLDPMFVKRALEDALRQVSVNHQRGDK